MIKRILKWFKKENKCESCPLASDVISRNDITDKKIEHFAAAISQTPLANTINQIADRKKEDIIRLLISKNDLETTSFYRGMYKGLNYFPYIINYSVMSLREREKQDATAKREDEASNKRKHWRTPKDIQSERKNWNEPPIIG